MAAVRWLVLVTVLLSGCAGANCVRRVPDTPGAPRGFVYVVDGTMTLVGTWHAAGRADVPPAAWARLEAAEVFVHELDQPAPAIIARSIVLPAGQSLMKLLDADHWDALLRLLDVPAERILTDEKGRSTYVTLLNCRRKWAFRKVLVVSQDYHLPRALYIASGLGMEAVGLAVARAGHADRVHRGRQCADPAGQSGASGRRSIEAV